MLAQSTYHKLSCKKVKTIFYKVPYTTFLVQSTLLINYQVPGTSNLVLSKHNIVLATSNLVLSIHNLVQGTSNLLQYI